MNFPIPFTKMSGTGNDFIIIDHRQPFLAQNELAAFVTAVCRRKFSVGADGLILIESAEQADFSWQFFNSDGSVAEMCGNGARCAARYAFLNGIAPAAMRFVTLAGEIQAEVVGEQVKLTMTPPVNVALDETITVAGVAQTVHSINTGVPHAVLLVDDIRGAQVRDRGREIRRHARFQPAGTNVNFAQVCGERALTLRTYERGVEDETLACGTGAVAGALIAGLRGLVRSPVAVTTSGGEILTIHFTLTGNPAAPLTDVFLEGPAHVIYQGELHQEALAPGG